MQGEALERAVGADEVFDEVVGGLHQQFGRGRELGDLAALLHHGDPIAHLDRLVDVVGHEEDGLLDVGLEPEELVLEAPAADRVDRAERLVHQHHRRIDGQRPGDADPLLLASGQLARIAVGELGVEADQVEQFRDPFVDPALVPFQKFGDGRDVLADGAVGEEPDLLDHVADLPPEDGGVAVLDGAVADEDVALGHLDGAVDHAHGGRLAAAGRPDQHADLAGRDLEVEVVDRVAVSPRISLGHAFVADRGGIGAV